MRFHLNQMQQDQSRSIEEKVKVVMDGNQLTLEEGVARAFPRNPTDLTGRALVKH